MEQCLAILLFHECSTLLQRWEAKEWATAQSVQWSIWESRQMEEQDHAERYWEIVEEGLFSD